MKKYLVPFFSALFIVALSSCGEDSVPEDKFYEGYNIEKDNAIVEVTVNKGETTTLPMDNYGRVIAYSKDIIESDLFKQIQSENATNDINFDLLSLYNLRFKDNADKQLVILEGYEWHVWPLLYLKNDNRAEPYKNAIADCDGIIIAISPNLAKIGSAFLTIDATKASSNDYREAIISSYQESPLSLLKSSILRVKIK